MATDKKKWFKVKFTVGSGTTVYIAIISVGDDVSPNICKRVATEKLAKTIARRNSKSIIVTEFEDLGDNPIFIS